MGIVSAATTTAGAAVAATASTRYLAVSFRRIQLRMYDSYDVVNVLHVLIRSIEKSRRTRE